jgi:uncharacterized integral membrane protein
MGQKMFVDIKTTNPSPGVGDKFKVSYILKLKMDGGVASISHNGIKINKPSFTEGFVVAQEGNESTSFGFGNRDMEISKYSFILQAKKKGKFEISPFTFTMNGEETTSGIFTINVGAGNPNAKIETSDPNLFARIELSKRNSYKGEATTVSYKVYTRYNGFAIEDYDMPMTNGLWKEEIKAPSNGWPQTTQTVNGKNYYVLTLKKEVIIPQKTGEIKLEPIKITALIGRSFFNRGQQKSINSNSPSINVKELPSPTPTNFSNQVGSNYKLNVTYSTKNLKTNDPLDVKVTIEGRGNLKQLTKPALNFPQDFEIFDPEVKDNVKISSSGISGSKSFNYLVIPRYRGTFEIPEYEFTYFDVKSKQYKTLKHPAQTIHVEKGENEIETTNTTTSVAKQNVEILNTDIRHISKTTTLYAKKDSIFNTKLYWSLIIIPFIIALLLYIYIIIKRNMTKDEAAFKTKNASKKATSKLKKAAELLNQNKHLEFYEELYKAMTSYCSHKLSIPNSILNKEIISKKLQENNVSESTITSLIKVLDECEMARFSPVTKAGAEQTLSDSNTIINQIEKDVKK